MEVRKTMSEDFSTPRSSHLQATRKPLDRNLEYTEIKLNMHILDACLLYYLGRTRHLCL